jgi:hypothetical protein
MRGDADQAGCAAGGEGQERGGVTAAARTAGDVGVIVGMDDLRRRATEDGRNRQAAAELADAVVKALPALIVAAKVVSESGDWPCREPVPRVGRCGAAEELEPCGHCLGCRMTAAQDLLAEVEL